MWQIIYSIIRSPFSTHFSSLFWSLLRFWARRQMVLCLLRNPSLYRFDFLLFWIHLTRYCCMMRESSRPKSPHPLPTVPPQISFIQRPNYCYLQIQAFLGYWYPRFVLWAWSYFSFIQVYPVLLFLPCHTRPFQNCRFHRYWHFLSPTLIFQVLWFS